MAIMKEGGAKIAIRVVMLALGIAFIKGGYDIKIAIDSGEPAQNILFAVIPALMLGSIAFLLLLKSYKQAAQGERKEDKLN